MANTPKQEVALISGAGPAGLTAAYELLKQTDIVPTVCEKTNAIGGISQTVQYHGNRMDIGGHRFFSKSDKVMNWWLEVMPLQAKPSRDDILLHETEKEFAKAGPDPEKEDRTMLLRHRVSRIFFLRKFFDYPISMKKETFLNMGLMRMMRVGFGMTENAAMSIYNLNNGMTKVGRIGIPMQKTNIGVFDENGNELTYNKVGELRISSPAIINGYYKNEKETANIIIDVNGERWIKTGDYASIDEDGNVQIIGRKRAMFVRPDGHNVFPDLIRDYLSGCPIIKEVCVIGIKSRYNEHGKIPTAIVVLKDQNINVDEAKQKILEYQSHLLGERDGALDVRFRDELPLTPIGKIDVLRIEQEESINMSDIDFDTLIAKK